MTHTDKKLGVADEVDEEAAQEADGLQVDPEVAKNYEDAMERGANAKGEGRIP